MCDKEVNQFHNILRQEHDDTNVEDVNVRDLTTWLTNIIDEFNAGGKYERPTYNQVISIITNKNCI